MSVQDYPQFEQDVRRWVKGLAEEIPEPMQHFMGIHEAVSRPGALSPKMKELIALGIAVAARCEGCIAWHVRDALKAGATRDEILEALSVAVLMGGGPSTVYGSLALEALNQFEAQPVATT